jgi:hypothetical protein
MEARSLAVCMTAIEASSLLVYMTVGGSHMCRDAAINEWPSIQLRNHILFLKGIKSRKL